MTIDKFVIENFDLFALYEKFTYYCLTMMSILYALGKFKAGCFVCFDAWFEKVFCGQELFESSFWLWYPRFQVSIHVQLPKR